MRAAEAATRSEAVFIIVTLNYWIYQTRNVKLGGNNRIMRVWWLSVGGILYIGLEHHTVRRCVRHGIEAMKDVVVWERVNIKETCMYLLVYSPLTRSPSNLVLIY